MACNVLSTWASVMPQATNRRHTPVVFFVTLNSALTISFFPRKLKKNKADI